MFQHPRRPVTAGPAHTPASPPRGPTHRLETLQRLAGNAAVAGILQRDAVPGYAQRGDTCQPASLLTAFLVWDRELSSPGMPNGNMLSACDAVLLHLAGRQAQLVTRLGRTTYDDVVATVERVRAALGAPGSTASEAQFQDLAVALSRVFDSTAAALQVMGIRLDEQGYDTLAEIFGSPELAGLTPGQIAQIEWYVNTRVIQNGRSVPSMGYHAFLTGRKADGTWFLSDQGNQPPLVLRAPSLGALRSALDSAVAAGQSWLDTRPSARRLLLTWSGVRVLSAPEQIEPRHRRLLPPGQALGTLDPGRLRLDIAMVTWDWIGMANSLSEARGLFSSAGWGTRFRDRRTTGRCLQRRQDQPGDRGGPHRFLHPGWPARLVAAGLPTRVAATGHLGRCLPGPSHPGLLSRRTPPAGTAVSACGAVEYPPTAADGPVDRAERRVHQ